MAELLRAPTEGYAEAIVVPPILTEHFELKHSLINMMTSDQFFRLKKDNPHDHIRWFNKITSTIKFKDVPNLAIKLMPFPFSLARAARCWLKKEAPHSILTWDDLDNIQGYVSAAAVNYNQFSQTQGYNRGNNFNQDTSYQTPIQQNQVVPLSELEKIKKINEVNIKAMQTQINNVKNELRNEMQTSIQVSMSTKTNELKNMMASFFQMNIASTSGPLPSNTIANSKGKLKAITTRSGLVIYGPSVPTPPPFINLEEDARAEETLTYPELTEYIIKVPPPLVQKAKPPLLRNYMVHQRDPRYKFALTDAVILKKLPEKLEDPGKFFIPCGFIELKCKVLSDLGIARDVFFSFGKFTFSTDFFIVDYESDPRVLLILGRPFLWTAHALIGEDKIKESKLLIDELDPSKSSDFLPSPECDLVLYEYFSKVDALPSTNNEDKVFNPGILIHENLFEVTIRVTPDKNVKKISIYNASLILEYFNPPLYELPFHKEVPRSETLLSFSSKNEEKVFNPRILTFKGVHTSLLPELSHRGPKAFKVIKIFECPMEIFPCSYGEDIRILDVSCLYCYPP
nr:hypothetical protein [Tanacetum cinerariifolium]